jgi:cold shock CspA family protein
MGRSQETFNKKEKEKKRIKKRLDKQKKKEERMANSEGGDLDNMIAYVDEHGNLSDTPPDPANKTKVKAKNIEIGVPKREKEDLTTERSGKVEFFNDQKGFGFIKDLDSQEKFFVHVHGLIDKIQENDLVVFEIERGLKGMNAVKVKKVK